jgi:hypoxanthine phosphoribosyltransferase
MEQKRYLTAQELLNDSFELGLRIFQSGFKPSFIIAIWRGGTPVGIAVQEMLDHLGVKTDHIAIRTSSYYGIKKRSMGWSTSSNRPIGKTACSLWMMSLTRAPASRP